jgi:hypothetical protein
MSLIPPEEKEEIRIKHFLDWDRNLNMFYNNIYLENFKLVIKMPLIPRSELDDDIKIRKFDLGKYTYLCSY